MEYRSINKSKKLTYFNSEFFRRAHERVHRMNENPVMFILYSLQKLHNETGFYPLVNVAELHRILTLPQNNLLTEINPALLGGAGRAPMEDFREPQKDSLNLQNMDRYQRNMHLRNKRYK